MVTEKKRQLQSSSAYNTAMGNAGHLGTAGASAKSIEETYQKKTQLEHILLRPDTYIGSVECHSQALWVYEDDQMIHRTITYVPGLYKIFDEILVNAADNKQRDPSMDTLKVEIDKSAGRISVYNNGDGIPVEIHKEEGVYVPELIFGHLLTSSNYDDAVKKTTGGRNGYGAKLTNIFSTEFIVETADGKRQKKYKQIFSNNMGIKGEPVITKCKDGENWTRITFKPDLPKFNMTELEDDVVALMKKRVVDLAGTLGKTVKVELNGLKLPVKTFQQYVDMYLKSVDKNKAESLPRIYEANDRWEVCFLLSEGQFQQVSFVNRIATIKGGSHVEYITSQITNHITAMVHKKNKTANLKPHMVKNHVWIFVNALIDNPSFDSQTKETLTTRQGSFGSKCELSSSFLKKVTESGIVDTLLSWADFKQSKDLKKTDGTKRQRLVGLTKLEDANEAGGRNSEKCTLILTEGDSAKALAMAGLSVVGRDYYGVFPLRGKLLNVREASHKQIMENAEIQNVKQILGLQHGKQYESVKSLRYGHLMIMTDQDHDGSHIKGLLINFIHSFWPSLLKIPTFLVEFVTPIVKATKKGSKRDTEVLSFYSMPDYELWKETLGDEARSWKIKYYKGLGTSDSSEGREYFSDLGKHKKDFVWADEEDDNAIELAFSKKKIEERKNWLRQFEPGTCLDQRMKHIKYRDFVNKELILFSMADLQRSIPSMVDGLKPGQRKILFCSFKKKIIEDIKVSQCCGYVSEHSAYHHGEQSLATTLLGMANDFTGSNNINLLVPSGQFGTRLRGGKDAAHARYIFTRLSSVTRFIFHKDDDTLLDYLNEDGQSIEPTWFMPIIPMVLVNGSEGIGTGWSTFVPNYKPQDILANIRQLINGEEMVPMVPWYNGFKGLIERTSSRETGATYTISGLIEEIDSTTLRITELPVRRWTHDYKEFLESLVTGNEKTKEPFIKDYRQYSDDRSVSFEVYLSEENLNAAREEGLLKKFKLTTTISTSNMHLFDANGTIKKYDDPEQILQEFFHLRLAFYEKRKAALLEILGEDLLKLDNKVRFVLGVVNGEIRLMGRKRAELLQELHQKGFSPLRSKPTVSDPTAPDEDEEEEGAQGTDLRKAYLYLLSIHAESFTFELVEKLRGQKANLEKEVEELKATSVMSLWLRDLEAFERALDAFEKEREEELESVKQKVHRGGVLNGPLKAQTKQRNSSKATAKPKAAATKKAPTKRAQAKKIEEEDDEEDEEILDLKNRLARYDINSPPEDLTSVEESSKTQLPVVNEISDGEEDQMQEDGVRKKPAAKAGPTGRRGRPAASKKPAQANASPEKKARKIRPSPFNKKSGSVLGRASLSSSSEDSPVENAVQPAPARPVRPSRAAPAKNYVVLSDSESEDFPDDDDSDFDKDED